MPTIEVGVDLYQGVENLSVVGVDDRRTIDREGPASYIVDVRWEQSKARPRSARNMQLS